MAVKRTVRLGKHNTLTIPAEMLRRLGVRPGDQLELEESDLGLRIRRAGGDADPIERAYGFLASASGSTTEHADTGDADDESADYRGALYAGDDEQIRRTGS